MIRFITAAPKTGSSYISGAVILMQTNTFNAKANYRLYPPWWSRDTMWHDWDLHPDLATALQDGFDTELGKGGAVYKGHFWATQKNIGIMEAGDDKLLIVLRSPLDALVAQYCSMLSEPDAALYNPIYPLAFREEYKDVDAGINYLITGGYLIHLLTFFSDWLHLLNDDWGIVMDYEGFIETPAEHMAYLAKLNNLPHDIGVLKRAVEPLTAMYIKDDLDPAIYPRGWTAGHGVAGKYVSPKNFGAFRSMYEHMLAIHPGMERLDQQYPGGV